MKDELLPKQLHMMELLGSSDRTESVGGDDISAKLSSIDDKKDQIGALSIKNSTEKSTTTATRDLDMEDRKKQHRPTPYSTLRQQRVQAEVQALRQKVHELEDRLGELQQQRREKLDLHASCSGTNSRQSWFEQAASQRQKRIQSEKDNETLLAIYKHRLHVDHAFRKVLEKKNVLKVRKHTVLEAILKALTINFVRVYIQGMKFVCQLQPMADKVLLFSDVILRELARNAEGLCSQVNSMINPLDLVSAVYCQTTGRCTETLGHFIESTSATPLDCSVGEAARLYWMSITKKAQDPDKHFRFVRNKL